MFKYADGTTTGGILQNVVLLGSGRAPQRELRGLLYRSNLQAWQDEFYDFNTPTIAAPWTTKIVGTTPTMAIVANTPPGIYRATLAATSEAETAGVDWGDSLQLNKPDAGAVNVNPTAPPVFEARVRFPAALAANQTVVIGIATAFNATLTSIAEYAWFRFNANNNVLIESKDGTLTNTAVVPLEGTTTVDNGTAISNFHTYTIDWRFLDQVRFFLDDNLLGTLSMINLTAAMNFQPVLYLQKASGTSVPTLDVDYMHATCSRF